MLISSKTLLTAGRISAAACFLGMAAYGQTDRPGWIAAPLAGVIANADHSEIRALQGVPGASRVGDPIALPAGVTRVYLAPLQQWALVEQGRGGTLGRMALNGDAPAAVTPIFGALSAPELVGFSSNGQNAVLLSRRSGGTLQVLTQLAGIPQISLQADVSQLGVTAAAVSDDGTLAAVLTHNGAVYLVSPGGSTSQLLQVGSPAALTFIPSLDSVAVADGSSGAVTVIDRLDSQPAIRAVIAGPALAADALFLQASSNGDALVVSAHTGQTAYRVDLANQSVQSVDLPVSFSRMERLNGDVFLISANPNEAAWLLQADGDHLRFGFAQFTGKPVSRTAIPVRIGPAR